jgi:hypothetical protein
MSHFLGWHFLAYSQDSREVILTAHVNCGPSSALCSLWCVRVIEARIHWLQKLIYGEFLRSPRRVSLLIRQTVSQASREKRSEAIPRVSHVRRFPSKPVCWLAATFLTAGLRAQSAMTLSPIMATPEGAVFLELSLDPYGAAPAALQWTFQYSGTLIRSVAVEDGPALASAGKTILCTGEVAAFTCIAIGLNTGTIAGGVVAKVTAVLADTARSAMIEVIQAAGVSAAGDPIPIVAKGQIIAAAPENQRALPPRRRERK